MIMRWEDLMPGDVLEYTEDYKRLIVSCVCFYGNWKNSNYFTIAKIDKYEHKLLIHFLEITTGDFPMDIDTGADLEYTHVYNGPVFKIVKVAAE